MSSRLQWWLFYAHIVATCLVFAWWLGWKAGLFMFLYIWLSWAMQNARGQ